MDIKKILFKRIVAKKGITLLLIAFFLGGAIVVYDTKRINFLKSTAFIAANIVGTQNNAVLSLSPNAASYGKGRNFSVSVLLNTKNQNAVAVGAYLDYDPTKLKVISVSTSTSAFNNAYEVINYNGSASYAPAGKIEIVKAKPSPGVKTANGIVAVINFKALSIVNPGQEDNLTFNLASSSVILDDGQGTNILSGVNSAKLTIVAPSLRIKARLEGKKKYAKKMYIKMLKLDGNAPFSSELEFDPDDNGDAEKSDTALTNLSYEDYKLFVRIPGYLKKRMTITWPPSQKVDFGEFVAGDIDGDNRINSSDWNRMKSDWGGKGKNTLSDVNEDGIVNALDWSFLNKNWNAAGDN